MLMQRNSVTRMNEPTKNTSKSPTMNENPSTARLPTRDHQHHANRIHETKNRRVMRSRVQARKRISFATGVVGRATLLDVAHQQMIARTSTKLEQSHPVMPTATCLASIGVIINSVTEQNDRTRSGKELLAFVDSGAVDNVLPKSVCT